MNDGLFEDYGEAIFYVLMALMIIKLMSAALGAFCAY